VLDGGLDAEDRPSDEVGRLAYLNAAFETGIENPLDAAIVTAGESAGLTTSCFAKIDEIPYDFLRRRLTIVVAEDGNRTQHLIVTEGAFSNVLDTCSWLERAAAKVKPPGDASARNTGSTITVGSALVRAWAIAEQGRTEEGGSAYDAALKEFKKTGAGLRMPHYLGMLVGIHRKAEQRAAGLKLLTEANQIADRNHETWCNAMLELERGELMLLDASEEAGGEADAAFKGGCANRRLHLQGV
jgi:magnesium-transporting ATPase (P-type)